MSFFSSNYDLIFFGIIIFSAVIAFIRGGIAEILSLSSWFIAFWALHKFGTYLDKYIPNSVSSGLLRSIIVFAIIFLVVVIIIAIIKKVLGNVISSIGLGGLNYVLGISFGIIRGILICALLVLIIEVLKLDSSHSYKNAKLYPVISPVVDWIVAKIPQSMSEIPAPPTTAIDLYKK